MNKVYAINAGIALAAAGIGCIWIWCLFWFSRGQGIVNMEMNLLVFDFIVVASLSLVIFALNAHCALSASGGWLGGQFILLVWDGMPHGRSPQMFQPTNFGESFILGLLVVIVLNWSILPGALLGYFLRYLFKTKPRQ